MADFDAANLAMTTLVEQQELLESKLKTLNNKVTLSEREVTNLTNYNNDLQKISFQQLAAADKLFGIAAAL
jgi:hypothetical protein